MVIVGPRQNMVQIDLTPDETYWTKYAIINAISQTIIDRTARKLDLVGV